MAVEIDVIVPLLQINSETKKEHHAACSILQPHSIFQGQIRHENDAVRCRLIANSGH
jgi:hypothetical protein